MESTQILIPSTNAGVLPRKICLLTEHYTRKQGTRETVDLNFYTASKELYDVPFFTPRLLEIYKERNIPINLNVRVKGVDTAAKQVHFEKSKQWAIRKSTHRL